MGTKKKNTENLSIREQVKPIFEKRFKEMLKDDETYQKFINCIFEPQRKSFRINITKEKNPKQLLLDLKDKSIDFTQINWSNNSYFLNYNEENRSDLGNLYEHFLGKIYIQEATSMCPVELLDIPNEIDNNFFVLDMAASPGSKTTQIGSKMQNKGLIVANEIDYKRLGPLKINLERSGLKNILITNLDGRNIQGNDVYDRVLLDAPCSGSGVIRKSPKTIKTYNPKKLKSMQNIQLKLLQRGFELLKNDGIIIYSTCSLDPEENEFVIKKFLERNDTAQLLDTKLDGLILTNKIDKFNDKVIPQEITDKTIRIWPQDNDTNGFFIAKIKKN